MVLDDHTLSETLFLALTGLSCATQMWHVLVGTQVWSKQKAYFSLLLIYSKVQRTQTHLGPLPTSSQGPLLSALTQFSPFPLSSQTTSCDRVLSHASRSERVWETCLCCRPHTALAIWVSDYWTSSQNSSKRDKRTVNGAPDKSWWLISVFAEAEQRWLRRFHTVQYVPIGGKRSIAKPDGKRVLQVFVYCTMQPLKICCWRYLHFNQRNPYHRKAAAFHCSVIPCKWSLFSHHIRLTHRLKLGL